MTVAEKAKGSGIVVGMRKWPRLSLQFGADINGQAVLSTVLPVMILLGIWALLSASGLFPRDILVPPLVVLNTLIAEAASGELAQQVGSSLGRLFAGYGLGVLVGLALGAAMGLSPTVKAYFYPLFQFARQVPTLALIPVFILFFGIGQLVEVILVAKVVTLTVALATLEGVAGIRSTWRDVAALYEVRGFRLLRNVIFPASVPSIMTGLRIALARAWMVLVAVELMISDKGIGQMLEWGRQVFRVDIVLGGVVLVGVIGFVLDRLIRLLEQTILRYGHLA